MQPGTIIATEPDLWPPSKESVVSMAIQGVQRAKGYPSPNWRASHVRLYLDDEHVFDCTYPRVRWSSWTEISRRDRWRLWYPDFDVSDSFAASMMSAAGRMIGREYDVGQLFSMATVDLLGYDETRRIAWFDSPGGKTVCSCAARAVIEKARHDAEDAEVRAPFAVMFCTSDRMKVNVENTHPAAFGSRLGLRTSTGPLVNLWTGGVSWRTYR